MSLHRDAVTGDWDSAVWNAENRRWITSSQVMLNVGRSSREQTVEAWSRPPASWTNGYGAGVDARAWQMSRMQPQPQAPKTYGFPGIGITSGLNTLVDAYNARSLQSRAMLSEMGLPFTDKTLGQTEIGQRYLDAATVQLPHISGEGIVRGLVGGLVPNVHAWAENGYAMPDSPLDLTVGQWKGGINLLSDSAEGFVNMSSAGKLTQVLTGYRMDLPRFDIPADQQMGATMFDVGMAVVSVLAPEARLGQAAKLNAAAAEGASRVALVDFSSGEIPPGFYRADPRQLRFTQSDASPNFIDPVTKRPIGTITSLVDDLRAGRITSDEVGKPLQVVIYERNPFSTDNRRLAAFNAAGVQDVSIEIVSLKDSAVAARFFNRFDPIRGEGYNIVITPTSGRVSAQTLLRDRGLIKGVQLGN